MTTNRRHFVQFSSLEYCDSLRHNLQTNVAMMLSTAPTANAEESISAFNAIYISGINYHDSTVSTGGTSYQEFVDNTLTGSNDYWNGALVLMNGSGESNQNEIGFVADWVEGTTNLTLEEKMTATIDTGDDYVISLTQVSKSNAASWDTCRPYGIAVNTAATNDVVDIRTKGVIINPGWSWTNAGRYVFLDTADGILTETPNQYGIVFGKILSQVSIEVDSALQALTPVQTFYPEFTNTILYGPALDPYAEFGASSEGDWDSYGRSYYYFNPTTGYRAATDEYYLTMELSPPPGFGELYKYQFEHKEDINGSYGLRSYLITDRSAIKDSGWQATLAWETYDSGALSYGVTPGGREQLSFKFHGSNSADYVRLGTVRVFWR